MRVLVLQHLAVEHPGIFRDLWSAAGHEWDVVELDEGEKIPALAPYDLMVAMGGPMDVWDDGAYPWLADEKAAIRKWVGELDRPFLGICLGHQLLAAALGGSVGPMTRPEVGLLPVSLTVAGGRDPLLSGLEEKVETLQWHGAEVSQLPPGGVVLAANSACPVQAMRVGRHAYGLQFHCEITAATVDEWKEIPVYRRSLEAALGIEKAARLGDDVASRLGGFEQTARRLAENLERLVGVRQPSIPCHGSKSGTASR